MFPVLDFHEIWLRLAGYIWHKFVIVLYLDKNISIFEIEFGFFFQKIYLNFIIVSSENVNHNLSR